MKKEIKVEWCEEFIKAAFGKGGSMMFSNPLALAIISMIIGMLLGAICCVLAFMVYLDLHDHDDQGLHLPSDQDVRQMCLWYEAEYGKDDE